jgi:predicted O-methyltransferase YrrM
MYDSAPPPSVYEHVIKLHKTRAENGFKSKVLEDIQQLDGWCSHFKASTLMELVWFVQPQVVVEIGVFGGKSLVPMAFALEDLGRGGIVYGIDPWSANSSAEGMDDIHKDWWSSLDHGSILRKLQSKIGQFSLNKYIQLIQETSADAPEIPNIDILHIDGNHSDGASYLDVIKWVPLVRRGGMIVFDDITWDTTIRATNWLDENCVRILSIQDEDNAWAIWVKS